MTKKDYELIAAALASAKPHGIGAEWEAGEPEQARDRRNQWEDDVHAITEALAADNPRFSRHTFYRATVERAKAEQAHATTLADEKAAEALREWGRRQALQDSDTKLILHPHFDSCGVDGPHACSRINLNGHGWDVMKRPEDGVLIVSTKQSRG